MFRRKDANVEIATKRLDVTYNIVYYLRIRKTTQLQAEDFKIADLDVDSTLPYMI